eukprot:1923509-Ditylum_brightwellii.AAC.2
MASAQGYTSKQAKTQFALLPNWQWTKYHYNCLKDGCWSKTTKLESGTAGEPISLINNDFIRCAKEVRTPIKYNKSLGVRLMQDSLAGAKQTPLGISNNITLVKPVKVCCTEEEK